MCVRASSSKQMRMGGDVMSEEEFAGNLGSTSSNSAPKGFEVQRNTETGAAGRGSGQYLDDRGPYGGSHAKGPDTIERKMREVRSVFGQRDDAADRYMNFMDNYRNSAGMSVGRGIQSLLSAGPLSNLVNAATGSNFGPDSAVDIANRQMSEIFDYANRAPGSVKASQDGLGLTITTPNGGTINMKKSGFTTYSGNKDPDYDGPFANLVNPPKDDGGSDDAPKEKTPLDPCPEGYKFNEETQSCEKVETTDEEKILGTNYVRALSPMPDLSNYGIKGGEYNFFSEMPGIIKAKDGLPRQPHGEVKGPGGPKDDLVGPILLSAQEYVEPYERVLDEGNGDYERGIRVLEKKRMAALRKYRDRVKSEERNRA